ncbi:hypothetical protein [Zunongwangia atlantica]|uniref:Uncharacterized protein n=1 Tax=Zunongwangia atlantica 22II14-10F7 TaxID=1185767 RepID=A0A1Y1SYX9_9FLAO|nr:hypothetical protein [Zunongwangia atlantica]ORL43772.1 hypothetical protein IIF7_19009 [Zunongwangia atlantica 22II14-10F7]
MATIIGVNIYIDGTQRNENPLSLTGTFNVAAWFNPGDNLSVESTLVYDDGTESQKSDVIQFQLQDIAEFDPLYQAVLDYANANSITTPLASQNLINDGIVRKLRSVNLLENDLLYYFKQDDASLYEFCTLNWMDPTKHRLTNEGTNDVEFVPNYGFRVSGGNDQYFSTNYTPSVHAVHAQSEDINLLLNGFDVLPTSAEIRLCGVRGSNGEINVYRSSNGSAYFILYGGNNIALSGVEESFNSQINISVDVDDSYIFENENTLSKTSPTSGKDLAEYPLTLFAFNVQGTMYLSQAQCGLEMFILGKSKGSAGNINFNYVFNNGQIYDLTPDGTLVLEAENSALTSIYFPQIQLASKYPELTTLKKYIVLYSTDHDSNSNQSENGKIAWGDADNVDLSDFQEKGVIWQGYQAETPCLEYVPNDPNNEPIHLYMHTDATDPANGSAQQTHLLTTAGGAELHNCVWTDRGTILGLQTDESHTGYFRSFNQNDGSIIGVHHTKGYSGSNFDGINRFGISTNNGSNYNWTRLTSRFDNTSFMTDERLIHVSPPFYFERNGNQYLVGLNIGFDYQVDGRKVAICLCDNGDFIPTELLYNISSYDGGDNCKICGFYIKAENPDMLHLYFTKNSGNNYFNPGDQLYHTEWDLTQLD